MPWPDQRSPTPDSSATVSHREALLSLLRRDGILYAGPEQPAVDRFGRSSAWMFYSWNVSLTARGLELAARCLLDVLETFEGTQLATYGTTAIPLLTSCLLLAEGAYTGLCVRERPKGRADGRQIEGPADRARPIVLIDDSLSSGRSLLSGIRVLESRGFVVEGGVALVHFPGRGGRERAEALGYRVATLFDIWDDLQMKREVYIPGYQQLGDIDFSDRAVADGVSPAYLARRVAQDLLCEGQAPLPPGRLDTEYDGRGGVWVSFRDRETDARLARDGFWHFRPDDADPCRDVILAATKAVRSSKLSVDQLETAKVAVTFFGPLERVQPAGLDFSRYGIVVRGKDRPTRSGGALPNTQAFTSEREQLDLAVRNARLGELEPYELFRHTLAKFIEPGADWLPYGAPDGSAYAWTRSVSVGDALTIRAREAAVAMARGAPTPAGALPDDLLGSKFAGIGVTLLNKGWLGDAVSWHRGLDEAVVSAARAAVLDTRFARLTVEQAQAASITVSVLHDAERIGYQSADRASSKIRLGRDSLLVECGRSSKIFLESVAPHHDWDKRRLADQILNGLGVHGDAASWTTYRTATWLRTRDRVFRCEFGFTEPEPGPVAEPTLRQDLRLLAGYISANILETGLPRYAQSPITGWRCDHGSAARIIHGLAGLLAAARSCGERKWEDTARRGLDTCLASVNLETVGSRWPISNAGRCLSACYLPRPWMSTSTLNGILPSRRSPLGWE